MPNYKTVRLEERVYQELLKRMKPRESMSQTLERLINRFDEVYGHLEAILEVKKEDK